MKLKKVMKILDGRLAWKQNCADCGEIEVLSCYAGDLMSDVLNSRKGGLLLLTALTNSQVVRTAEVADIATVCFVNGKQPQPDTVHLAEEKGIPLFTTHLSMFEACGRLYDNGLATGDRPEDISDCKKKQQKSRS